MVTTNNKSLWSVMWSYKTMAKAGMLSMKKHPLALDGCMNLLGQIGE